MRILLIYACYLEPCSSWDVMTNYLEDENEKKKKILNSPFHSKSLDLKIYKKKERPFRFVKKDYTTY